MTIKDINISDVGQLVLSGASVAFVIKVIGAGAKYLAEIFYAQWLGSEQYGVYAFSLGWAQLLAVVAGLGFGNTVLRFVPQYLVKGRHDLLRGMIRRSQQIVIGGGILVSLVVASVLYFEGSLLGKYGVALLVGIVAVPLMALLDVQSAIIKSKKHIALALISPMVLWPIGALGLTYVLLDAWETSGGVVALVATTAALLLLCGFQFGGITQIFEHRLWSGLAAFEERLWFATALPLLLVAGFQTILSRTDIIMTGAMLTPREVGLYNAAVRTGGLVSFVLTAFNAIGAPMISQYWSAGEQTKLEETVTFIIRWTFWPSLGLVILVFIAGDMALSLFGDEFVAAYWALAIVAVGQLVNACAGPVGYLLALTGHERVSAKVYGVTALINVPLNYLLIVQMGIAGAAVATAGTMVIWNIWLAYEVKRQVDVDILAVWKKVITLS